MRELARLPLDRAAFRERYGPWAVIAGASEGTGECYARELAEMGINLVLVSRRQPALQALGEALQAEHGIDFRAVAQDLTEPGAGQRIVEAAAGLMSAFTFRMPGPMALPAFSKTARNWRTALCG